MDQALCTKYILIQKHHDLFQATEVLVPIGNCQNPPGDTVMSPLLKYRLLSAEDE